jgi:hypothetical protein
MRLVLMVAGLMMSASAVQAAGSAWVAIYREGNNSVALERASVKHNQVNLLDVAPKFMTGDLVVTWTIRTRLHEFDCAAQSYRILAAKTYDKSGKMVSDETAVAQAFKGRSHRVDTKALRKARALVCQKSEPAPAKPFESMAEAIAWMAN